MKNPFRFLFRGSRVKNELTPMQLEELVRRVNSEVVTDSGVNVTVDNAQGLAAVASSVRYLSDSVAQLPLVLYRRTGLKSQEPAKDLPLYHRLNARPNELRNTSYQWRKLGMRDLLLRGNWYNLKVMESRGSYELIRLHPDAVEPKQNPDTAEVTYEVKTARHGTVTYTRDQILHFWFDSDDGVKGLSPIHQYRNNIGDGLAIREHGSKFFSNAARLLGILEQDSAIDIDPESLKALLSDFNNLYTGGANAHKTAALPKGFSFKEVSISMEDAQWIEARKTTAREIFGIYGVPPHKGGDLADATFSNVENENISAVIDAVSPRVVALEQSMNTDLLDNSEELFFKFNMSGLLRGDFKSRQDGLNIQRRAGVISANEWRALEDMNRRDDDGGDEYIIETNMKKQDGVDDTEIVRQRGKS